MLGDGRFIYMALFIDVMTRGMPLHFTVLISQRRYPHFMPAHALLAKGRRWLLLDASSHIATGVDVLGADA